MVQAMKTLQIAEYLVVDERNAMEYEKGLLADAHEAALCFTGAMSYNHHDMALRIRRLIALAVAQQHQIISMEHDNCAITRKLIEVEQDKKDLQGMYKELSEDFQSAKDTIAICAAVKEAVEYNSMQD
jgi:hypothetical protein